MGMAGIPEIVEWKSAGAKSGAPRAGRRDRPQHRGPPDWSPLAIIQKGGPKGKVCELSAGGSVEEQAGQDPHEDEAGHDPEGEEERMDRQAPWGQGRIRWRAGPCPRRRPPPGPPPPPP